MSRFLTPNVREADTCRQCRLLETAARYAFPKRNGLSVLARILILGGPRDTLEDIEVKLRKLASLKDQNLISEEEYHRKRQDIIAGW